MNHSLTQLTDDTLIAQVKRLAQCERHATVALVAHLAEFDGRRLFLAEGCSSLFKYCTRVLHLSKHAAYVRIKAVRAVRRFPVILDGLASGDLNLTSIRLLAPHLTTENCAEVLEEARNCSRRQIETLVARLNPLPDVPAQIRKLPARILATAAAAEAPTTPLPTEPLSETPTRSVPVIAAPSRRDKVLPLAPERFKVQFTASASLHENLRRAQDLLRHRIPNGDLSQVFELALNALVERLEKERFAATDRPRKSRGVASGSRTIPAEVKRAVWMRDGGRCAFIDNQNRRCDETGFLEFHHLVPHGREGEATITNIALRCRAHNQFEAVLDFGPWIVREEKAPWGEAWSMRETAGPWSTLAGVG